VYKDGGEGGDDDDKDIGGKEGGEEAELERVGRVEDKGKE